MSAIERIGWSFRYYCTACMTESFLTGDRLVHI